MVVKLISNDNIVVEFGKDEIHRIPYVTDIMDEPDEDIELSVLGVSGTVLKIIKELLELQTRMGVPFKCAPIEIQKLGVTIKKSPIHTEDPWEGKMREMNGKSYYMAFFDCLSSEECVEAFCAADYLKCYDLRFGIAYIIAKRQLVCDPEVHNAIKEHLSGNLMAVYVSVVINED